VALPVVLERMDRAGVSEFVASKANEEWMEWTAFKVSFVKFVLN
jgi:hypothetical protein